MEHTWAEASRKSGHPMQERGERGERGSDFETLRVSFHDLVEPRTLRGLCNPPRKHDGTIPCPIQGCGGPSFGASVSLHGSSAARHKSPGPLGRGYCSWLKKDTVRSAECSIVARRILQDGGGRVACSVSEGSRRSQILHVEIDRNHYSTGPAARPDFWSCVLVCPSALWRPDYSCSRALLLRIFATCSCLTARPEATTNDLRHTSGLIGSAHEAKLSDITRAHHGPYIISQL